MIYLHEYWRSSAAYRVRIALMLKGLDYTSVPQDLAKGAQHSAPYRAINLQGLVPALDVDGLVLVQSCAIIEWLDERFPIKPLLPADINGRGLVRSMAGMIACDIHPLQNLRVGKYLTRELGADDATVATWTQHWIGLGFAALEPMIAQHGGRYAYGNEVGMVDCMLVPQVFAADRFGVDMAPFPRIAAAAAAALELPEVAAAHPSLQPGAPAA